MLSVSSPFQSCLELFYSGEAFEHSLIKMGPAPFEEMCKGLDGLSLSTLKGKVNIGMSCLKQDQSNLGILEAKMEILQKYILILIKKSTAPSPCLQHPARSTKGRRVKMICRKERERLAKLSARVEEEADRKRIAALEKANEFVYLKRQDEDPMQVKARDLRAKNRF